MHSSDASLVVRHRCAIWPVVLRAGLSSTSSNIARYLMIDYDFRIIKCLWSRINLILRIPGNLKLHIS
jgi:hypothetical protein